MQCPEAPPAEVSESDLAGWALLALLLALGAIELILIVTGRPTISQWMQRKTGHRKWWAFLALAAVGVAIWHLLGGKK